MPGRRSRRAPPASRASSGRCTTSCSRTSRRSTARRSRSTRRSWGSTWPSSRPRWTRTSARKAIEADAAGGGKIGARGTPTFFINGKFLSGAQPFEAFKAKIDEELKTAEALVAKGTPKAKVYDALMKDAKAEVPAAPAAAPGGGQPRQGPEADTKVYTVAGRQLAVEGPEERRRSSRGLLRLPVPVLHARRADADADGEGVPGQGPHGLEELPAAVPQQRRAGRRGRDGRAARRASSGRCTTSCSPTSRRSTAPSLEKYAQELGLDMAKFKADLDSGKYKDADQGRDEGRPGRWASTARRRCSSTGARSRGAYPFETFKKIADEELAKKTGKKGG